MGSVPNAGAVPRARAMCHPRAVAIANDIEFGLASYFYVRDIGRIWARGAGTLARSFAKLKPL